VEHTLAELLQRYTYPAMLLLLSAAGVGVPISEDLVLLTAGALASQGVTHYVPALVVGYVGVLIGDTLIYHWGKKLGPAAYEHRLVRKVLSPERAEKLHGHFARHGFWTVVVGRHAPGLRAPVFFLSGASGVRFRTFFLADALSAAVTVPVVVMLGYLFGEHLYDIRRKLHEAHWIAAGIALLGAGVWWFLRKRRRRRELAEREMTAKNLARRDVRESSGTAPV
jgi:membrane-associated protein